MLIPSTSQTQATDSASLSRRVNANSQHGETMNPELLKLIKKGEC